MNTEYYQPNDTPNQLFRVVVNTRKDVTHTKTWHIAKIQPNTWVKVADKKCALDDCLFAMDDGSLLFHNEGALWYSESRYRIDSNKLIPISFVMVTFMHNLFAIFLAFVVLGMVDYGLMRWRLRHSKEQTALYHQQILNKLRIITIGVLMVVLIYNFGRILEKIV